MSRVKHEIISRDGRVAFRSSIDSPVLKHGDMVDILYQESGLMGEVEKYLLYLVECHEEKLVRVVGRAWMEDRP